jgi:hypothetical protein
MSIHGALFLFIISFYHRGYLAIVLNCFFYQYTYTFYQRTIVIKLSAKLGVQFLYEMLLRHYSIKVSERKDTINTLFDMSIQNDMNAQFG